MMDYKATRREWGGGNKKEFSGAFFYISISNSSLTRIFFSFFLHRHSFLRKSWTGSEPIENNHHSLQKRKENANKKFQNEN